MLKNFIFSKKGKQSVECVLYCEQHLCLLTFPFNVFFFTGTSRCFVIRPSSLAVVVLIAEPHAEPLHGPGAPLGTKAPCPLAQHGFLSRWWSLPSCKCRRSFQSQPLRLLPTALYLQSAPQPWLLEEKPRSAFALHKLLLTHGAC